MYPADSLEALLQKIKTKVTLHRDARIQEEIYLQKKKKKKKKKSLKMLYRIRTFANITVNERAVNSHNRILPVHVVYYVY